MTDAGPLPRFEIGRVLAATGQTLVRQWRPLALIGVFCAALPSLLVWQLDRIIFLIRDPVSEYTHPFFWNLDFTARFWLFWLAWAVKVLLVAVLGVIAASPLVWTTLNDQRGRAIGLAGGLAMLRRCFWPLVAIALVNNARGWGHPLAYLLPFTNAAFVADVMLRGVELLLTAWFAVAVAAAVEEGLGFRRAMARSAFLTRGHRLVMAGLTCGLDLALERSWQPIRAVIEPLQIRPWIAETALVHLAVDALWIPVVVFETILYLEMRRLRDPFPPAEAVA